MTSRQPPAPLSTFKIGKNLEKYLWKALWTLAAAVTALCVGYCDEVVAPITWPDEGEPAVLYSTQLGDDLGRLFYEALSNAKESIFITSYSFSDRHLAAKLREQGQKGIAVTVVCDKEAAPHISKLLGPDVKLILRHHKGLMHIKIALIDNQRVIVGTANLTRESLTAQGNLVASMHSRALASYLKAALSAQLGASDHTSIPRQATFSIGGQTLEMWLLPDNSQARERLLQLIAAADKSIRVAMFTFTRQDFAQELSRAKKRGMAIKVTLDYQQTLGANKYLSLFLERLQIPVSVSRSTPLFHYKVMNIDDKTLICGSANWTRAAFAENDDCFFVLYPLTEVQQERLKVLGEAIDADSQSLESFLELQAA